MKYMLLIAGVAAIAVGGCVEPELLFQATPVSNKTVWYNGSQYVSQTQDSITVSVAFLNQLESAMTFYVVVGNEGSKSVIVDPGKVFYEGEWVQLKDVTNYSDVSELGAVTAKFDTLSGSDTVFAYDPETELQGIDKQVVQANATYANETSMNVAAGLLQVVGDLATVGKQKSAEELHREKEQTRSLAETQANNNLTYSLQSATLAQQRAYWENAALRKTTLFQGNAIGGRVRVRVDDRARTLKLFVPVGEHNFMFEFTQMPLAGQ